MLITCLHLCGVHGTHTAGFGASMHGRCNNGMED